MSDRKNYPTQSSAQNKCTINDEVREKFLMKLASSGSIMRAAMACGASYDGIMDHRKKDPVFEKQVEFAKLMFNDHLEDKLYQRAVDGLKEPQFDKNGDQLVDHEGNPVYKIRVSDRLFEMMIKRHIPEYREKMQVDHNVTGGVLVVGTTMDNSKEWMEKHGKRKE